MKRILILGLMVAGMAAQATIYNPTYTVTGGTIPDGNPVGTSFYGDITAPAGDTVSSLSVSFTVTGGYNSDLYAYLLSPNGTMVVLLNQAGGLTGSGFNNVTFSTGPYSSIQTAVNDGVVSGTWNAAGDLANFAGAGVNGTWTLYFADLSGGATSTLNSWSLDITAVPEPVNVALGVFGVLGCGALVVRIRRRGTGINHE